MHLMQFERYRGTGSGTVAVFRFGDMIADDREMAFSRIDLELRVSNKEGQGQDASLERSVLENWPIPSAARPEEAVSKLQNEWIIYTDTCTENCRVPNVNTAKKLVRELKARGFSAAYYMSLKEKLNV